MLELEVPLQYSIIAALNTLAFGEINQYNPSINNTWVIGVLHCQIDEGWGHVIDTNIPFL